MKTILLITAVYFIADQLLQLPIVRKKKHESVDLMIAHVLTYTLFIFLFAMYQGAMMMNIHIAFFWPLICGITHLILELFFSRLYNPIYYGGGNKHHYIILLCVEHTCILLFTIISFILISKW